MKFYAVVHRVHHVQYAQIHDLATNAESAALAYYYLAIYKDKETRGSYKEPSDCAKLTCCSAANSYIEGLRWFPIAWLLTAEAWVSLASKAFCLS